MNPKAVTSSRASVSQPDLPRSLNHGDARAVFAIVQLNVATAWRCQAGVNAPFVPSGGSRR